MIGAFGRTRSAWAITAAVSALGLLALILGSTAFGALAAAAATGLAVAAASRPDAVTLSATELDALDRAESFMSAPDLARAAERLARDTASLIGARSAVVVVETVEGTVRATTGPDTGSQVFGPGSRTRLLDDDGVQCGSITVSARADGRAYGPVQDRLLDALAERVSMSLHRRSLVADVRDERQVLDDLVAASSDGIFSVSADMTVRTWNRAMEQITGVEAAAALRHHLNESFRPLDAEGRPATGARDPGRARVPVASVPLQIDTGDEVRWLSCSYAPLADGGFVVIARDETERKKVQDDKDGWIAQVSHELRTPLTPIKGFLHTLSRRNDQLDAPARLEMYEIMLREEERLERLVDALLRATQIAGGGTSATMEAVRWDDLVAEHVRSAGAVEPDRIGLTAECGAVVTTDPTLVGLALSAVLSNALKFSPPTEPVEVLTRVADDRVEVIVCDHGPGIPQSDRVRIFDKFTRLGDHLTRPEQGVGLGLHIARTSIERIGGEIAVTETPGGGATFTIAVPIGTDG